MDSEDMTTVEREEVVLKFMAKYELALPLAPIYENLKRKEGITFSKRTVKRRLQDLQDKGQVRHLDIGRGYWEITEEGRKRAAEIEEE